MPAPGLYRLTALAILAAGSGCSGSPSVTPRSQTFPVEGRLVVSGIPASYAQIAFHPILESGTASYRPVAVTGPDGSYRLMTWNPDDGAPAGEYTVTVIWPNDSKPIDECTDPITHDRLLGYYADPGQKRIVVTVLPQANLIDLKITVGSRGWDMPLHKSP